MSFTFTEFPDTSYYHSDLRQILVRLREIDDNIGKYDDVIDELKAELSKITGLYSRVTALEVATADLDTMRTRVSVLETKVIDLMTTEKTDVARLEKEIADLRDLVSELSTEFNAVFAYIDAEVDKLNITIANNYRKLLEKIIEVEYDCKLLISRLAARIDALDTSVLNPWHLEEGRIEQDRNQRYVYSDLSDNVPTASEYCELDITADEYSSFGLRAITYARHGKERLHYYWVYDPVSGIKQDINNVLTHILDNHFGTISAAAYAALALTADAYAAEDMTALDYYHYL